MSVWLVAYDSTNSFAWKQPGTRETASNDEHASTRRVAVSADDGLF